MGEHGRIDPAERDELERRDDRDAEHGALRGDTQPKPQPDGWASAKIDVAGEAELRRRQDRAGEPPATAADESVHGAVDAATPREFTGLRTGSIRRTAAGLPAVGVAMRHALDEMGAVDGTRMLLRLNQPGGIDCQSCAWPDPPPGRALRLRRVLRERGQGDGRGEHPAAHPRRLLPPPQRGRALPALRLLAGQAGSHRRADAAARGATHYEPVSWDDAFRIVAEELNALGSPDEAAFYTSGRTANETAFLWQLFVRQFGTNNLPDCSNMCHESSGAALTDAIGIGKGTVTLEDVLHTDLLITIGQNPGTCHPRMLSALQELKRNGGRVIAVNPLPETGFNHFKHPQDLKSPRRALGLLVGEGTPLADLFVPVRIAGDLAFLKGVLKEMLEEEDRRPGTVFDHEFVREHTSGYDELVGDLRAEDWGLIVEQSGVERREIRRVAEMVVRHERLIVSWAMGLTQQPQAVAAIQSIVNLLLLRGSIGKPGAGALPVRGHSNVQGDRTVGIWERMPERFLDALGREFGFEPPRHHGYDTVETIRAMHAGRVKVFLGMGGNFLSATPDTEYTAAAATLPADGARLHQAEPRPPRRRPPGADPADHRPRGARRAGDGAAAPLGGELDGDRARHPRHAAARLGAAAQRADHRRADRARHPRRARHGGLGVADRRLRPRPRAHRAGGPGLRGLQPPRPRAGRVLPPQPGPRPPRVHDHHRQGEPHRAPRSSPSGWSPASC
jgi:hypothetical protein